MSRFAYLQKSTSALRALRFLASFALTYFWFLRAKFAKDRKARKVFNSRLVSAKALLRLGRRFR